ncbi:MAG: rRNA pseudouridine synthase [Actinobacteria bacterium]|nr:rRNA pseudouridine synthase [Actinomycetota bacterium]
MSKPARRRPTGRVLSPTVADAGESGERLQKVLARAGLGGRRHCDALVAGGHVKVNGTVARPGHRVDLDHDTVEVDGVRIGVQPGLVYYLLNKPAGVVTTADDPQGRPTVVELVPTEPRVFPVGRLDYDTEGLLIVTNDGELAHRLTHPSFGIDKEYLATVEGAPGRQALRRLREGVELDDGTTAPAQVSQVAPGLLRITIHEGRNRQVRRMCEAVGFPVARLVRHRIGPLTDRKLRPGEWRPLTIDEVRTLERAVATERTPPVPKPPKRANRR